MIVYLMSKEPKSLLIDIQTRIWREHHPQADLLVMTTRGWNITHHVNHAINLVKPGGHRFAFILHVDCLPARRLDPEQILKGHALAGRVAPDGMNVHPSRTWMVVDTTVEGKTWLGYGHREATNDDLPVQADDSFRRMIQLCEPGFIHFDNWYKRPSDSEEWRTKRDWILSAYSSYAELPSLPARVLSFGRAMVNTARQGFDAAAPREVWTHRLAICQECDAYDRGRCRYCGCGMRTKSRLKSQSCPIGKWASYEENESVNDQGSN